MTHAPDLADRIDDLLPQTQCTRCGYSGCRPYAEAIADGAAGIDRCPPGGDATIARLARLVGCEAPPLDTSRGMPAPLLVARIDEAACIGCTLCIQACPVDAIVGAQKRMHGVLSALCSGCELCVAPCPVDCIAMAPAGREWRADDANAARARHADQARRHANAAAAARVHEGRKRQAAIAAALARARARRTNTVSEV
ncbi:MAG TPA: RnfABCDGE type electron transport complex subunit B [Casimicrobiaceae bacterium]|nr:RnfABCDGE type electron transport complex subunit B [Casimicrobiaceae bacterium]